MFIYHGIDYSDIIDLSYTMSTIENHSMGTSLETYIKMKLQDILLNSAISEVEVIGDYNRNGGTFLKEKDGKIFNYKRPTVLIDDNVAIINCYPGIDYVYHYASLVKTYFGILGIDKKITVQFPLIEKIKNQLMCSNIKDIPKCKTVILGYVQAFEYLSNTDKWLGAGDFMWKQITEDKLLVGCKHSYWGILLVI